MAPLSLLRSTVFRRTLGVVLLLAFVASAVIGLIGWHANSILTRATSAAIAAEIAELKAEFRSRGIEGLAAAVAERSLVHGNALYHLEDASGERRAGNLDGMPAIFTAGQRVGTFSYRRPGPPPGPRHAAAGVLIEIDNRAVLLVGRDIEEQRALLFAIYRSVGIGAAVLALLGVLGGIGLASHILKRIGTISATSAGIVAGRLSERIPLDGSNDELDRLAAQLNDMLSRIEQLMGGLREVSDNIAHDLRTPLNRLRNRAEAALADGRGAPAWHEGLERVLDEADELIKIFNALLLIARLEAGSAAERFETTDAAAIVRDLAEFYEPVADEAGFQLACTADDELPVRANRQLLGQAVTNLIDNALKYARKPAEGAPAALRIIEVGARRVGSDAVISVADRGPGIRLEDRERALKRFVRLEQSRSEPGTGLGLSLVAAVARLHQGSLRLEDNAPGLRVILVLPLAPPAPSRPDTAGSLTAAKELASARR